MSETKTPWTEGPWSVSHRKSRSPGNGVRVEYEGEYRNDGWVIAELLGPDAEANARLIGSAPALAEALQAFMTTYAPDERLCDQPDVNDCWKLGRAALALAKGETK